jgi:hypothetical protein
MERIYDKLNAEIPKHFPNKHLAKPQFHKQVKEFMRTGDKNYQPFTSTGFEGSNGNASPTFSGSRRSSKLGNNICVLQPQNVLGELHKKSYFKGATGFMMG